MKLTRLFKRAVCLLMMVTLALTLCACSVSPATPTSTVAPTQQPTSAPTSEPITETSPEPTGEPPYRTSEYTRGPNENSSVLIRHPWFNNNDWLDEQMMETLRELAHVSVNNYPEGTAINIDYHYAVTMMNSKLVSIVFWGYSYVEGGAHPFNDLIPITFDLVNKNKLTLTDLFEINDDFETVFFEKAFYPTPPETSYTAELFPEMLDMQRPENNLVSPFSYEGGVTFFAKPDGIVLSMPAVHATGSDHFEAQLNLSDISSFYLPSIDYWSD